MHCGLYRIYMTVYIHHDNKVLWVTVLTFSMSMILVSTATLSSRLVISRMLFSNHTVILFVWWIIFSRFGDVKCLISSFVHTLPTSSDGRTALKNNQIILGYIKPSHHLIWIAGGGEVWCCIFKRTNKVTAEQRQRWTVCHTCTWEYLRMLRKNSGKTRARTLIYQW